MSVSGSIAGNLEAGGVGVRSPWGSGIAIWSEPSGLCDSGVTASIPLPLGSELDVCDHLVPAPPRSVLLGTPAFC